MSRMSSQLINIVDLLESEINGLVESLDIKQLDLNKSSHKHIYELIHLTRNLDKIATELRILREKL